VPTFKETTVQAAEEYLDYLKAHQQQLSTALQTSQNEDKTPHPLLGMETGTNRKAVSKAEGVLQQVKNSEWTDETYHKTTKSIQVASSSQKNKDQMMDGLMNAPSTQSSFTKR